MNRLNTIELTEFSKGARASVVVDKIVSVAEEVKYDELAQGCTLMLEGPVTCRVKESYDKVLDMIHATHRPTQGPVGRWASS